MTDQLAVVVGGGAMRGPAAVGALQHLEQAGMNVSTYTGVSIGSVIAAMRSNNVSYDDVRSWFVDGATSFGAILRALVPSICPLRYFAGGLADLVPIMRHAVDGYGLAPKHNLRVVAYDVLSAQPFVFEGEDYDLGLALAASCSVPMLFRPVPYFDGGRLRLLVDGGVYHPHPASFCKRRAVVIKLIDVPTWLFPDRPDDLAIDAAMPDAQFFTRLTDAEYDRLHAYGAHQAQRSSCCQ